MAKKKKRMEYRYYEIPADTYVLPLLGKGWEQEYGVGIRDMLHFHNYMEIGYCYHGDGELIIEDRTYHYSGQAVYYHSCQYPPYDQQFTGAYL